MRVITKNVTETLSVDLIQVIWNFYDEGYQTNIVVDDYQFFTVVSMDNKTHLNMWQEIPPVMKTKSIPHCDECEVWIINDGDVVTMLLPGEY